MPLNLVDSLQLLRNSNRQLLVSVTHQAAKFEQVELKKIGSVSKSMLVEKRVATSI